MCKEFLLHRSKNGQYRQVYAGRPPLPLVYRKLSYIFVFALIEFISRYSHNLRSPTIGLQYWLARKLCLEASNFKTIYFSTFSTFGILQHCSMRQIFRNILRIFKTKFCFRVWKKISSLWKFEQISRLGLRDFSPLEILGIEKINDHKLIILSWVARKFQKFYLKKFLSRNQEAAVHDTQESEVR